MLLSLSPRKSDSAWNGSRNMSMRTWSGVAPNQIIVVVVFDVLVELDIDMKSRLE